MKLFNLITVVITSLLIHSCFESTNGDDSPEIIRYTSILSNQEHNVIMPLKVGNKWIYEYKEFDSTGKVLNTTLESIEVLADTSIGAEKWFKVIFPVNYRYIFNKWSPKDIVLLTNTDVGLFLRIDDSYQDYHLEAQYLLRNKQFSTLKKFTLPILEENSSHSGGFRTIITKSSIDVIADSNMSISSYSNCFKYKHTWHLIEGPSDVIPKLYLDPLKIDFYKPNLGLVKSEIYSFDDSFLSGKGNPFQKYSYELKEFISAGSDSIITQLLHQYLNKSYSGTTPYQDSVAIFVNNSTQSVMVSDVKTENSYLIKTSNSLPETIQPGKKFVLKFQVNSSSNGDETVRISTICNNRNYDVYINI